MTQVTRRDAGTVIWLHGLGQSPDTMMQVAERISQAGLRVRGVFPAAPLRDIGRVTKAPVSSWYEQSVYSYQTMDMATALGSENRLRAVLADEAARAEDGKVVIAGFSQGAAMGLLLGLRSSCAVAGVMIYASYLPDNLDELLATSRRLPTDVPIWVGHGKDDDVVPIRAGGYVRNRLREWGYEVTWQSYRGGHDAFGGVPAGELDFLRAAVGSPG